MASPNITVDVHTVVKSHTAEQVAASRKQQADADQATLNEDELVRLAKIEEKFIEIVLLMKRTHMPLVAYTAHMPKDDASAVSFMERDCFIANTAANRVLKPDIGAVTQLNTRSTDIVFFHIKYE